MSFEVVQLQMTIPCHRFHLTKWSARGYQCLLYNFVISLNRILDSCQSSYERNIHPVPKIVDEENGIVPLEGLSTSTLLFDSHPVIPVISLICRSNKNTPR